MKEKPKTIKMNLSLFIILLAIPVIVIMAGVIYIQKTNSDKEIANLKNDAEELQATITELQGKLDSISNIASTRNETGSTSFVTNEEPNKIVLDSNEFKDWKVKKGNLQNELMTLEYSGEEPGITITIYKAIDSTNISDIKQYVASHSFDKGFIDGDNMTFVNEKTIKSNNWIEYSEKIEGTYTFNDRVYAANNNNKLCIIRVHIEETIESKHREEINKLVNKIQNTWNLDNPNDLNITVE